MVVTVPAVAVLCITKPPVLYNLSVSVYNLYNLWGQDDSRKPNLASTAIWQHENLGF